jgi:hypothetical protein
MFGAEAAGRHGGLPAQAPPLARQFNKRWGEKPVHYALRTSWGVEVQIHVSLSSEASGQFHAPAALGGPRNQSERRGEKTLPPLEVRPLSRPARSQSLYGLSFRGGEAKVMP